MKVGDLVYHTKLDSGLGIITDTGAGWTSNQVVVRWTKPVWFDPKTGLSHEYAHNLKLISEG